MKLTTLIPVALSLALLTQPAVAATVVIASQAAAAKGRATEKFERLARETMAQPDAWAAYQQVTRAAPKDAPLSLREQYRDLAISLVLKAALKCSASSPGSMAANVTQNARHILNGAASAESAGAVSSIHHGQPGELQHASRAGESHESGAVTRTGHVTNVDAHSRSGAAGSTGQAITGSGGTLIRDGEVNVRGGNSAGQQEMLSDYQRNQDALRTQAEKGFGGDNEIAKSVAAERSANESKIHNSSEEIDKNKGTVRTSSDNMKGEADNVSSKFKIGRKEAELDQYNPANPLNDIDKDKIQADLERLRKHG